LRVEGLGCGVWDVGFGAWGLEFGVSRIGNTCGSGVGFGVTGYEPFERDRERGRHTLGVWGLLAHASPNECIYQIAQS